MSFPDYSIRLNNRYSFIESRRSGGFAAVDICWDNKMQRRVAIKRIALTQDDFQDSNLSHEALSEARTAALFSHPNIVTVYDFEVDHEYAYIIMENIDGLDLAEYLESLDSSLMTLNEVTAIVEALGSALEFAHENGVLHLDVKPTNVLIDRDGRVKLADFGVAELKGSLGFSAARGGTDGYMAPEQEAGLSPTTATDVYSLGALVYELLTAHLPFNHTPEVQSGETPPPPSNYDDLIDPVVDDVILTALETDPSYRMPLITEFIDELAPALGSGREGQVELAAQVSAIIDGLLDEDEIDRGLWGYLDDRASEKIGILTKKFPNARDFVLRIITALLTLYLSFTGLRVVDFGTDIPIASIVAGLLTLVGFVVPRAGALLGLAAMGIGASSLGSPLLGISLILVIGVWWLFGGRGYKFATSVVALPAGLGVFGASSLAPLLAGLFYSPARAALTAFVMSFVSMLVSAITGVNVFGWMGTSIMPAGLNDPNALMLDLLSQPDTWITILGWIGAAAAVSGLARTRVQWLRILSGFVGALILVLAHLIIIRMENGGVWHAPDITTLVLIAAGGILLVCCVVFFGIPSDGAPEEDA